MTPAIIVVLAGVALGLAVIGGREWIARRRRRHQTSGKSVKVRIVVDTSHFQKAMQRVALSMARRPLVVDLAQPFWRRVRIAWEVLRG